MGNCLWLDPARKHSQGYASTCSEGDRRAYRRANLTQRSAETMQVTQRQWKEAIVVAASGRVELSGNGELGQALLSAVKSSAGDGHIVIVDLSGLEYTDSGWKAVMGSAKEARAAGV